MFRKSAVFRANRAQRKKEFDKGNSPEYGLKQAFSNLLSMEHEKMYKLVNQSGKPLCNANGELVTFSRYVDAFNHRAAHNLIGYRVIEI